MSRGAASQLLSNILNMSCKYDRIAASDKKETSVTFGVRAIIKSVFAVLFALLTMYGLILCGVASKSIMNLANQAIDTTAISLFNLVLGALCIVIGALSVLFLLISGGFSVRYQFKLNKKPIRIVALVLFLASVVSSVGLIIFSVI